MLGEKSMVQLLNRVDIPSSGHGFRSSFRWWCSDTGVHRYVAADGLSHSVGDTTEQSYARSDVLELRRPVMQTWADYMDASAT